MRRLLPLVPAWLVGLWILVAGEGVWDAASTGRNINGDTIASGWVVLGFLIVGTVLYAGAPFFGHKLAVSSTSSYTVGLGQPNPAQRAFGTGFVRVGVLLSLYLLLGCMLLGVLR